MKNDATPAGVVDLSLRRAIRVARRNDSFAHAWSQYQAGCFDAQQPKSTRDARAQVARMACERFGDAAPTYADLVVWLEELGRGKSPATVAKWLGLLKGVVSQAALMARDGSLAGLLADMRRLRKPKLEARERRDASQATVDRLEALSLEDGPFELLAVRLAAYYGLRAGELLGLRPGDVRFGGGHVRVHVERTRDHDGVRRRKNALNGKLHVLAIGRDERTASLLAHAVELPSRLEACAQRGQRALAGEWLMPWGVNYPARLMDRWREDPGVVMPREKGDAWHALRHYGATRLAESGASERKIQAWLGDSTSTAAATYVAQVRGTTEGGADEILAHVERWRPPKLPGEGVTSGSDHPLVTPAVSPVVGRTEFDTPPSKSSHTSECKKPRKNND